MTCRTVLHIELPEERIRRETLEQESIELQERAADTLMTSCRHDWTRDHDGFRSYSYCDLCGAST